MKLTELLKEADALTYMNSLKTTLVEIKEEFSQIEEMQGYINQSCERVKKLMRRADNQYRVINRLVQQGEPSGAHLTVDSKIDFDEIERIMQGEVDNG